MFCHWDIGFPFHRFLRIQSHEFFLGPSLVTKVYALKDLCFNTVVSPKIVQTIVHNCQNEWIYQHTLFEICSWSPKSSISFDVLLTLFSPYECEMLFSSFVCVAFPLGVVEEKCNVCVVFVVSFFTILLIIFGIMPLISCFGIKYLK